MDRESILANYTKTAKEIAAILGCSVVTVSRWRKKSGIQVPRGSKKGVPKPALIKRKSCVCPQCKTTFEVIPSKSQIYCSISCATKNHDKSYMQSEVYKNSLRKESTPAYRRYRNRVTKLSEKTYQENIGVLNSHGYDRTVCGVSNGYQLDHIMSVRECFDNGLTPEEASKLENLQLLPWKTNLLKR